MLNNRSFATTEKVVYVLGAGFSKPAGAPRQTEILGEIFKLDDDGMPRVADAKEALRKFLRDDLHIRPADFEQIALEDIYTPIDRCIADGTSFRSQTASKLGILREHIGILISRAIDSAITREQEYGSASVAYVDEFASHVVERCSRRALLAKDAENADDVKRYDPLSIISLNWDILLDRALSRALSLDDSRSGDYDAFGVVDYCCYISSLDGDDRRIRSGLWTLGCRGYNIKLLKLHGSMNWLQCPNCQRLFVSFDEKRKILDRIGKVVCRHCLKYEHENLLQGSLVMPTFLKDLSNFQIKLVWQNAAVEIMEAKRLVFIGYSLPQADFEFRQLLSRMIHREAVVEAVLYKGSAYFEGEKSRYLQFFSGHDVSFPSGGVEGFVGRLAINS